MKKNKEEKALANLHYGFFERIKNFLKVLFLKEKSPEATKNTTIEMTSNKFRETIQIKQDEEKMRILELQQEFKKGNIEEEEIPEDDYSKLIKLYDEQNEKLRQEIERYKIETYKKLQEMKNE